MTILPAEVKTLMVNIRPKPDLTTAQHLFSTARRRVDTNLQGPNESEGWSGEPDVDGFAEKKKIWGHVQFISITLVRQNAEQGKTRDHMLCL